jgi:hypothetical protein
VLASRAGEILDHSFDEEVGIDSKLQVEQTRLALALVLRIVVLGELRLLFRVAMLDHHYPVRGEGSGTQGR